MQLKQISKIGYSSNKEEFELIEKNKFLKNILEALEIKKQDFFDENSIDDKIKFKNFLMKNNLKVVEEENFMIFFKDKLIAKMHKPSYTIKKDPNKDKKNQVYMEAVVVYETYLD